MAEKAAPFLLLAILFVLLWWLVRRWWRLYRAFGPLQRGRVLLLSVSLGLAIAALLRAAPYVPDAARVAGEGAPAGWNAGFDRAVDQAGERLDGHLNRGDAPELTIADHTGRAAGRRTAQPPAPVTRPHRGDHGVLTIRHYSSRSKQPPY